MADPFPLTTSDPRFDPNGPVTVNGFLYVPADGVQTARRPVLKERPKRRVVEVKRRQRVVSNA